MNQIMTFGEKTVEFSTSFAWAIKYSNQFHRDAMKDLAPALTGNTTDLSMDTVARIAWASAALCDKSIEPDLEKWIVSLGEDFNFENVVENIIGPVLESSITAKKSKAPSPQKR